MHELAHTDKLTQLANRRRFDDMLDHEWRRAQRSNAPLALILLVCRAYRAALCVALAAVLVGQHTWAVVGTTISGDEGGVTKYLVTSLGPGFYLWCGSFVLIAVAALIGRMQSRQSAPPPLPAT